MAGTDTDGIDGAALQELLLRARRLESALTLATRVADPIAGLVCASRLRRALRRANVLVDDYVARAHPASATMAAEFWTATRGMYELLQRAPCPPAEAMLAKLARWVDTYGRASSSLDGPHLFEVDAGGVDLSAQRLLGVHAIRCNFMTAMPLARVEDSFFERCDFTYANLVRASWLRTRVHSTSFRGATFSGAALDRLTFIECDLRGADLSVGSVDGTADPAPNTGRVVMIRCDLRGSTWRGRDLERVRLQDCKLHGVTGISTLSALHVVRGDISPEGDGSHVIGERVASKETAEFAAERGREGAAS